MKLPCHISKDLIPLHIEGLLSPQTTQDLVDHLETCSDCRTLAEETARPSVAFTEEIMPLEHFKKAVAKRKRLFSACLISLILLAIVVGYSYLSRPIYAVHPDSYRLYQAENKDWRVEVKGPAREVRYTSSFDPEIGNLQYIEVWTTRLDKLTRKDSPPFDFGVLKSNQEGAGEIFLMVQDSDGFLVGKPLFSKQPHAGGMVILPRLALNLYFRLFVFIFLTSLFLWFLSYKYKRKNVWIGRSLSFASLSYLLSHLLIKGAHGATYKIVPDFSHIIIVSCFFFAAFTFGFLWLRQYLSDRRTTFIP